MPTYEYECKKCSNSFEVFQSMSDEPIKSCPKCGKEVRRLIFGGAGIIFKGSGFYVNDKASGSSKGAKRGESAADTSQSTSASAADSASKGADSKGNADSTKTPDTGGHEKNKPAVQTA